jgi:hypothetical protein
VAFVQRRRSRVAYTRQNPIALQVHARGNANSDAMERQQLPTLLGGRRGECGHGNAGSRTLRSKAMEEGDGPRWPQSTEPRGVGIGTEKGPD